MTCLVHISDLHFGRTEPAVVQALTRAIQEISPDLVVVSGDLTQRARLDEFKQAQDFLQSFMFDKIIVPGNHDVPLYSIFERLFFPFWRFRQWLSPNLYPTFENEEISILGITTAHARTVAGGKLSPEAQAQIQKLWIDQPSKKLKVLVSHHPFEAFTTQKPDQRVGFRSHLPTDVLLKAAPDLLLSGHLHQSVAAISAQVFPTVHRSMVCAQAGSAISTRLRVETNAFNRIELQSNFIRVEKFWLDDQTMKFSKQSEQAFVLTETGWQSQPN